MIFKVEAIFIAAYAYLLDATNHNLQ